MSQETNVYRFERTGYTIECDVMLDKEILSHFPQSITKYLAPGILRYFLFSWYRLEMTFINWITLYRLCEKGYLHGFTITYTYRELNGAPKVDVILGLWICAASESKFRAALRSRYLTLKEISSNPLPSYPQMFVIPRKPKLVIKCVKQCPQCNSGYHLVISKSLYFCSNVECNKCTVGTMMKNPLSIAKYFEHDENNKSISMSVEKMVEKIATFKNKFGARGSSCRRKVYSSSKNGYKFYLQSLRSVFAVL